MYVYIYIYIYGVYIHIRFGPTLYICLWWASERKLGKKPVTKPKKLFFSLPPSARKEKVAEHFPLPCVPVQMKDRAKAAAPNARLPANIQSMMVLWKARARGVATRRKRKGSPSLLPSGQFQPVPN